MKNHLLTTILLVFPYIGLTCTYEFPYDLDRNREEEAMRAFYEQEAERWFALYGYAPMDVHIQTDGIETGRYQACYQEVLWESFFKEGGEPWHGRFNNFSLSLIERRYHEDNCGRKAA